MTMRKKWNRWYSKRLLAGTLALGLLAGSPVTVLAAENIPEEAVEAVTDITAAEESQEPLQARRIDGSEEWVTLAGEVLAMVDQGTVYLDEESGYLLHSESGLRVDPLTGETETPVVPDTPDENTGGEDTGGNTENPGGSDTSGQGDSDGTDAVKPEQSGEASETEGRNEAEQQKEDSKAEENPAEEEAKPETNEELIARQTIVEAPEIKDDFRFYTVEKEYGFAKERMDILESVPSAEVETQEAQEIRAVGRLWKLGVVCILEEKDGWLYVESGDVRGFVEKDKIYTGEDAGKYIEMYEKRAKLRAEKTGAESVEIDEIARTARKLVANQENKAYTYLRATVQDIVVEKKYALVNATLLNIREGKSTENRIVGTIRQGELCYILAEEAGEWIYVESGDVRGFVKAEYLTGGEQADAQVAAAGEETFGLAVETVDPKENKALYYTITSVREGDPGEEVRNSILEFAAQFIGKPYVWGGTSLTDGADCSGFVQQIYKAYGYTLPRVAEDQAQYGTKIAVEDAQPGDLIFYAEDGYIYHVVMYAGDGRTIEAANQTDGIIYGKVYTRDAVWATRIL